MIQRVIWCMWEPKGTMPDYLALCLRTMERNAGVRIELLSPDEVQDLAPRLDPDLAHLVPEPGQRSDYYRSHLLHAQGGMWLDVDTIVMRDANWIFDLVEAQGLLAARRQVTGHIGTTPLVARRGDPILERWIARQERVIAERGSRLNWTDIGARALTSAVSDSPFIELPRNNVAPIAWKDGWRLWTSYGLRSKDFDGGPTMINLYNNSAPADLSRMAERDVLMSRMATARLLRISLGLSTWRQEMYGRDLLLPVVALRNGPIRLAQAWYRARARRSQRET